MALHVDCFVSRMGWSIEFKMVAAAEYQPLVSTHTATCRKRLEKETMSDQQSQQVSVSIS